MITSEQAGFKKPDPEMFQYAFRKASALPENSVMIGDNVEVDITGAKNSGMDQVLFDPGGDNQKGLATYKINCMSELMKIL